MTYYPPDLQKWGEGSVGFSALTSNATCKLLSRRDMAVPLASARTVAVARFPGARKE